MDSDAYNKMSLPTSNLSIELCTVQFSIQCCYSKYSSI